MEADSETDANVVKSLFTSMLCGATASMEPEDVYQKLPKLTTGPDSPYYNMSRKRGICVILNHRKFKNNCCSERTGTNLDKKGLIFCFRSLGYEIKDYDDLECIQILSTLRQISKMDHSEADSFVCCVLTHGQEGMLNAYDRVYSTEQLYVNFRGNVCPTLCGKPKIFIIQACQGFAYEEAVVIASDGRDETDSTAYYTIPRMADFLVALSTVPGYFSWRDTECGSWYIQHLVRALREDIVKKDEEKEDLLSILTTVNRRVAYDCSVEVKPKLLYKQMSCFQSSLTRKVTFPSQHQ